MAGDVVLLELLATLLLLQRSRLFLAAMTAPLSSRTSSVPFTSSWSAAHDGLGCIREAAGS